MATCKLCKDTGVYDRWSYEILPRSDFIEPDEHEARVVDGRDTTPEGAPYWAPGRPIQYLNGDPIEERLAPWVERAPCVCTATVSDYERRKADRAEREAERAEQLLLTASAQQREAVDMLPDFGQPIIVGHHSERRHRRLLERSDAKMGKAVQAFKDGKRLASKAKNTAAGSEISSDDPHAPAKLRARALELDVIREDAKARNKSARKRGLEPPVPAFELRNLGANVRRLRKRADDIEAMRSLEVPEPIEVGAFSVSWDQDANRVRIESPRPGTPEERKRQSAAMKRGGFRWSRRAGAWQRHASRAAWDSAQRVAGELARGAA